MAGGLLDLNDAGTGDQWNIDPADLARMASAAGAPSWTPSDAAPADVTLAATDAQPAPAAPLAPPATMADTGGGGFWHGLTSGIGDVGLALGGGIDPSITGEAASVAGRRALLNFSLAMLANSGPSYTPRNFGQILASGLDAAGQSTLNTEQNRLKAQQVAATYALKAGQQKIQEYLAGIKAAEAGHKLGVAGAVSAAAGGGGGTAPAAGDTGPPGAVPPPDGAYGQGGPDTTPVPDEYMPYFQEASARTGIPVDVLIAQARQESSFNPTIRGKAGEIGLAQVMPSTALAPGPGVAPIDPAKLTDPRAAINFQADYLRAHIPKGMDPSDPVAIRHALVGYNGGGDKEYVAHVTRYLPPPATRTQVAGPGVGAAPPAPSSAPPSPGTGVVGPPTTEPVATVNAAPPTAPLIPRATLAPPDFSDIPGRRAAVKATYDQQLANVRNSGDPTLRERAETEFLASNAAIDAEVSNRKAAHAQAAAELDAKQNEAEAKLAQQKADAVAERQNKIDLAHIGATETRMTNKEAVTNAANQKGFEQAATEQTNASDIVRNLEGFRALSDSVGQPGWLQTTKMPGSTQTIAEQLQQMGVKLDDTGGVQLLRGGINNLVKSLRQGMAMGSLSDRDLNFIERMGPTEWMDQDTRTAAISYLQQAYQQKMKLASTVQKEMSRGKNYGDALDAANASLPKSFVPIVDPELTQHWTDTAPEWAQKRIEWAQRNDVRRGTLFHFSNGQIHVMGGR